MGRIHHRFLFRGRDEYAVIHPSCPPAIHAAAFSQPKNAVGRTSTGKKKTPIYTIENAPLLWDLMKGEGHWLCGDCKKASLSPDEHCSEVVWDDAWIQSIGMSRFETVPEWERFFDSVVDSVASAASGAFRMESRGNPVLPIEEHERVLKIVPPYDRAAVVRAYRAAVQRTHPDRPGGSAVEFKRVMDAKEALFLATG